MRAPVPRPRQVGYVVLFAPAFPIASLVCYVSFLFEVRTDAYKLLASTQRPRYAGAQDIGSWMKVLYALGIIGVFWNADDGHGRGCLFCFVQRSAVQ